MNPVVDLLAQSKPYHGQRRINGPLYKVVRTCGKQLQAAMPSFTEATQTEGGTKDMPADQQPSHHLL